MSKIVCILGVVVLGVGISMPIWRSRVPADAGPAVERGGEVRRHPVLIHMREGPPMVETGLLDSIGKPVRVRCSTCHATRPPNQSTKNGSDLKEFHQGLKTAHGGLTCLSCHNPGNYDTLRLADGRTVSYAEQMTLCAQCHGPQMRDYERGAHGGMTGYWDLTRGPRRRNSCVDCHDPHAPEYPLVRPVFEPNDRFPPHKHEPRTKPRTN
jgi:formate-dependent nitrite reductase cytochrome c552 subunit